MGGVTASPLFSRVWRDPELADAVERVRDRAPRRYNEAIARTMGERGEQKALD